MPDQTLRDRLDRRRAAMKIERESFDSQYQATAQFVSPRRGRFNKAERNRGGRSYWNKIINNIATLALRTAVAGMFNGIMSPSRPWLVLETDDPGLMEFGPSKQWFFIVQEQMRRILNASNLYAMAPTLMREQLLFATGCMSHEDDLEDLARFYTHTVGSYWIEQNDRFQVDTVAREFELRVEQIVTKFSRSRRDVNPEISRAVRDQYDRGNYHSYYPVVQLVEPNIDFRPGSLKEKERAFRSYYYEPSNVNKDDFLSDRGFFEFPFHCPRWDLTNEDVYGTDCPGMTALGDTRQLQLQERRKAQGIDKMVSPPLHGPAALSNQKVSTLPAGGTFYDAPGQSNTLKAIYEVNLRLDELAKDMERVENRINRAFFVDLFLAISAMEGVQPRNQLELMQRNQERLLQLGPTLERQFGDFLDPMVSRTFNQMVRVSLPAWRQGLDGVIPPPPPELQNRPIRPRYVSTLALAQQVVSTGNIDRIIGVVGAAVEVGGVDAPEKIDWLQLIDEYASLIGTPPRIIRSDDDVAQRQAQRAQQQQVAAGLEMGQQAAEIARAAGSTKLDEDTLAGQAVRQLGGRTGE